MPPAYPALTENGTDRYRLENGTDRYRSDAAPAEGDRMAVTAPPESPPTGVPARTLVLAAGTFAVGTDAFVVAGVLPEIGRDLHVGVAAAGQLVTVFSIAYAVLSPVMAALT